MKGFTSDFIDENGFVKSKSESEYDKFINMDMPEMSSLKINIDFDFFNCGTASKNGNDFGRQYGSTTTYNGSLNSENSCKRSFDHGYGSNSKNDDDFSIHPAAYDYSKRVVVWGIGRTRMGYFKQTDPLPLNNANNYVPYIKGIFTDEITGEKTEITVRDSDQTLAIWGVVSYLFNFLGWGKDK